MLLRQHLGRCHQCGLRSSLDRAQHRQRRHQRLAGADVALQKPQHSPIGTQVRVDLRQRPGLRRGRREAEPFQSFRRAIQCHRSARVRPWRGPGPAPKPARPDRRGTRHTPAVPACAYPVRLYPAFAQRAAPPRNDGHFSRRSSAASCHSAKSGNRSIPWAIPAGDLARPQTGGQRPDRLDRRNPPRLGGRHDVIGMRDRHPAVENFHLAGDQQLRARRHLRFTREPKKHQFGGARRIADHDPPGLAGMLGPLVPDHLDRQCRHRAGAGGADRWASATIQIRLRHVEQQIDHPIAARGAGDQLRHRRTYASQRCQRCEKRAERVRVHGLT